MATEIKMPQLGLTMTEGTINQWLKKVGDEVKAGEALVEITTDKLTSEVESETDGVLLAIYAQEGEDVAVQGVIGVVGGKEEKINAPQTEAPKTETADIKETQQTVSAPVVTVQSKGGRIKISPLAKKTAVKMGVDYSNLAGSGPGGRIVQKDILQAAQNAPAKVQTASATPAPQASPKATELVPMDGDRRVKLAGMRKVVAERMFRSHNEIPCVTQNVKVDVTKLIEFRKQLNEGREKKFSINDLVLKAVAKALSQNKHILCSLDGDEIVFHDHVNLAMAVALDDGLIVPVIKDADKLGLEALSAAAKDLAARAREGKLAMDEYKGSTFTVSNLGMFHVETFTPIINQPDAAILGICAVQDELALEGEKVVVKKVMRISMTFDHRLIDGATGAKFKVAVKDLLENPMDIIL